MANIVRLLKAEELLDLTPMSKSLDQAVLKSVIYLEQTTKTQGMLGTTLYNALLAHVTAFNTSGIAFPGRFKELLDDYVIPSLIQWSYHAAVLHFNLRVTDKGVLIQGDTNATQADRQGVNALRREIRNNAEFLDKLMYKFLCEYQAEFLEWKDADNFGVSPNNKPYFSGMQLG